MKKMKCEAESVQVIKKKIVFLPAQHCDCDWNELFAAFGIRLPL